MGVSDLARYKCIAFDMDTNALKEHYTKGDWHNAYNDIGKFLGKNGFKRAQGSVYDSVIPMRYARLNKLVRKLTNNFEWFAPCVKSIKAYDQPQIVDYTRQIKERLEPTLFSEKDFNSKDMKKTAMKEKARQIAKNSHSEPSKDKGLEM